MKAHNATYPQLRDGAVTIIHRINGNTLARAMHDDREVVSLVGVKNSEVVMDGPEFSRGGIIHDRMVGPYHN